MTHLSRSFSLHGLPAGLAILALAAPGCVATLGDAEGDCDLVGEETECPSYDVTSEELRVAGAWVPDANALNASNGWTMEYDDAPAWNASLCSGNITSGGQAVREDLRARFPGIRSIGGYSCRRNTGATSKMSVHGTGRALDIMIPTIAGDADNTTGDAVAAWLMRNSKTIGIQLIIWDHTVWSPSRAPGNRVRRYTGPNPHVDHLHVELTRAAGRRETPYFGGAPVEEPTPVEPPPLVDHAPPAHCGALAPGEILDAGDAVGSCDGRFALVHQADGNVVLYGPSGAMWATDTNGTATAFFAMQTDGNLVLYDRYLRPIWETYTSGRHGAWLALQDDGNAVLYHGGGVLFATDTVVGVAPAPAPEPEPAPAPAPAPSPSPSPTCGLLGADHALAPGAALSSCDGRFVLVHQGDGNVVLYQGSTALFHTGTHGQTTSSLVMQSDGNLVLYTPEGTPIWHTGTHGNPGSTLAVQDDGNVVIYAAGGPVWASGTNR